MPRTARQPIRSPATFDFLPLPWVFPLPLALPFPLPFPSPTRRLRFEYSTSRAIVDLPEPDTPVITTRRPIGTFTSALRTLCSSTRSSLRDGVFVSTARLGVDGCESGSRRNRPVI